MLFNSIEFIIFLPLVVILHFLIPHKFRWILLLIASYYFYMCWKPEYIFLIIISTLIDYFASIMMDRQEQKSKKVVFLVISLCSNLGLLFLFKYFNFFNDSARMVLNHFNIFYGVPAFKMLLPIGISFYTFQTLSYSIDVFRGNQKAEKHLGIFALYVSFFPQLVAGPIERSTNLLPQFYKEHSFDYNRISDGLRLMLWGFFKKIVIADRLAILVNQVYNNPTDYNGLPLIIATVFFAFQIYCDFSGYSDIAIGTAQILGYRLMDNFKRPYFSKSISEFWSRWHISLSTWFKDYLYIPLGGNRVIKIRYFMNLFLVFLVSGLWHGANWTFVVWGALHGFYLVFSIIFDPIRQRIVGLLKIGDNIVYTKYFKICITFILVCFAWIFFRANSIDDALYIVRNLFNFEGTRFVSQYLKLNIASQLGMKKLELLVSFLVILFMETVHLIQRHSLMRQFLSRKPIYVRWSIYYVVILTILIFGSFNLQEFIYFQF